MKFKIGDFVEITDERAPLKTFDEMNFLGKTFRILACRDGEMPSYKLNDRTYDRCYWDEIHLNPKDDGSF